MANIHPNMHCLYALNLVNPKHQTVSNAYVVIMHVHTQGLCEPQGHMHRKCKYIHEDAHMCT